MSAFGTPREPLFIGEARDPLLKVADARKELRAAQAAWNTFREGGGITIRHEVDEVAQRLLGRVAFSGAIPKREVTRHTRAAIHDARDSLNNFVHAVGVTSALTPEQLERVDFPIETTQGKWTSSARTRLKGLPNQVIERARDLQPFSQVHNVDASLHPLVQLREISNIEKHRDMIELRVAVAPTEGMRQLFDVTSSDLSPDEINHVHATIQDYIKPSNIAFDMPLSDGDVVYSFPLVPRFNPRSLNKGSAEDLVGVQAVAVGKEHVVATFAQLEMTLRFTQNALKYMAGISDIPPAINDRSRLAKLLPERSEHEKSSPPR